MNCEKLWDELSLCIMPKPGSNSSYAVVTVKSMASLKPAHDSRHRLRENLPSPCHHNYEYSTIRVQYGSPTPLSYRTLSPPLCETTQLTTSCIILEYSSSGSNCSNSAWFAIFPQRESRRQHWTVAGLDWPAPRVIEHGRN